MPAIKRSQHKPTEAFSAMHERGAALNENNDCVVKMVALITGWHYDKALKVCADYGRKPREGMFDHDWKALLRDAGYKLERVSVHHFIDQYPKAHRVLLNVTTHHPDRFNKVWSDGNTYILHCIRHVALVKDGVNHDWTRGRAKRVNHIFRVTRED